MSKCDIYVLSDEDLQTLNFEIMCVPSSSKINDTRKSCDFKTLTFCGAIKTQVSSALNKSIQEEKLDASNYWALQLLLSGYCTSLFDKLISVASKNINISNPLLPSFLLNKTNSFKRIMKSYNKDSQLQLRNNQEMRHLIVELVTIITLSRKRKLENIPKLKQSDFSITIFKTKLESNENNNIKHILKENDPSEIRIASNELLFQLNNKNMNKALYWLSWILEWEKIHVKKYKIFNISDRYYEGIDNKYSKNIIWLIWDIINFIKKSTFDIPQKGLTELDSLWNLYKMDFTVGSRSKKLIYILWSMKILVSYVDWELKLIEREYLYFYSLANVNILIQKIKPNEVNHHSYNDSKYKLIVKDNYIKSEKTKLMEKNKYEKEREIELNKRIKEAKKKKISMNSLNKLDKLKEIDKYLNY
jgi:hypothetical protein